MAAMAMSEVQHMTTLFSYWDFFHSTPPLMTAIHAGKINILIVNRWLLLSLVLTFVIGSILLVVQGVNRQYLMSRG